MTDHIKAVAIALGLGPLYIAFISLIGIIVAIRTFQSDLTKLQIGLSVINFIMNPPSLHDILAPYVVPVAIILGIVILLYLLREYVVLAWNVLWENILEPLLTLLIAILWAVVCIPLAIILIPINLVIDIIVGVVLFFAEIL